MEDTRQAKVQEVPPGEPSDSAASGAPSRAPVRRIVSRSGLPLTLLATSLLLVAVLPLLGSDLSVPFTLIGDARSHLMIAVSVLSGGWYYEIDRLGAPFGSELYDYPLTDQFTLAVFKVLGWLTGGNAGLVLNLTYLLSFLLAAAAAYLVLRRLAVAPPLAIAFAVLYSFLPYHLERGVSHLFLSMYFAVPLAIWLILKQMGHGSVFFADGRWRWRRDGPIVAICLLVSTTGIYYTAFAVALLVFAALVRFLVDRNRRAAVSTVLVLCLIGLLTLASLAPTLLYQRENGLNPQAVNRPYLEVEYYGLRPVKLLVPIAQHRIVALRQFEQRISQVAAPSEGGQNLGLIGSVGLLGLLVFAARRLFGARGSPERFGQQSPPGVADHLSLLAVAGLLLGTVAGLGAILGAFGFTEIRSWNRIVVYIAFLAFAGAAVALQRWLGGLRRGPIFAAVLAPVVMFAGVADQTPAIDEAHRVQQLATWDSDRTFVREIERTLGPGSAVFQLPYIPFPEHPAVLGVYDYDHLRGYLHSETLRWSYGGMKGREPRWQEQVVVQEVPAMLVDLVVAGFDGLYVDRAGYEDQAEGALQQAEGFLRAAPLLSNDQRLAFFDLRALRDRVVDDLDAETLEVVRTEVILPLRVEQAAGFFEDEAEVGATWNWAPEQATLQVFNDAETTRVATLHLQVLTGDGALTITAPDGRQRVEPGPAHQDVAMRVTLPPGATTVEFSSAAPPLEDTGDQRRLVFQVRNLTLVEDVPDVGP